MVAGTVLYTCASKLVVYEHEGSVLAHMGQGSICCVKGEREEWKIKLVKMGVVYHVDGVVVGMNRETSCSTSYRKYSRGP